MGRPWEDRRTRNEALLRDYERRADRIRTLRRALRVARTYIHIQLPTATRDAVLLNLERALAGGPELPGGFSFPFEEKDDADLPGV